MSSMTAASLVELSSFLEPFVNFSQHKMLEQGALHEENLKSLLANHL